MIENVCIKVVILYQKQRLSNCVLVKSSKKVAQIGSSITFELIETSYFTCI